MIDVLQALSTWITCDGIESCRRGCGGHGYSLLSGLPTLYASYVQNATWEGDNNVLCLQVSPPTSWLSNTAPSKVLTDKDVLRLSKGLCSLLLLTASQQQNLQVPGVAASTGQKSLAQILHNLCLMFGL